MYFITAFFATSQNVPPVPPPRKPLRSADGRWTRNGSASTEHGERSDGAMATLSLSLRHAFPPWRYGVVPHGVVGAGGVWRDWRGSTGRLAAADSLELVFWLCPGIPRFHPFAVLNPAASEWHVRPHISITG